MGATQSVEWNYFPSASQAIQLLREDGNRIFAVEQVENSIPLTEFSLGQPDKLALVFGNEISGVGEAVLRLCDGWIEIPQLGMKHSLNISVAAGIVLWEILRERIKKITVTKL